ncbi:MAG: non-canonical purine NTP pyrophosphatase [Holophagales bacterium]|nr:non-canonical purine NTP pyrophosphatase [Holophagales bacterium]
MESSAFVLVTGNPSKAREAERILGYRPETRDVDLPEIQSLDLREVLRAKAEEAWSRLGRPIVVEETGLELSAMNGFPGPLVKWMLEAVGPEGIARAAHGLGDPEVRAVCALAYFDGRQYRVGEGVTAGTLVLEPRGEHGFGWDPVFVPEDGGGLTYAELAPSEKDRLGHRGKAWRAFARMLSPGAAAGPSSP